VTLRSIIMAGGLWVCLQSVLLAAPAPRVDDSLMPLLRRGEIVMESNTSDENGASVSLLAFIRAPVERIWEIIISCRYVHAFVAGLEFCQVLQDSGDYALTRQVVDKGWTTPRMDFTFETRRQPFRHMEFQLTEGNLKSMHGSWDFAIYPDGVVVRHELALQPLLPAPRWLVRRNLKKDLPDMLRCIRGLASGSGTDDEIRADLAQCPGKVQ